MGFFLFGLRVGNKFQTVFLLSPNVLGIIAGLMAFL